MLLDLKPAVDNFAGRIPELGAAYNRKVLGPAYQDLPGRVDRHVTASIVWRASTSVVIEAPVRSVATWAAVSRTHVAATAVATSQATANHTTTVAVSAAARWSVTAADGPTEASTTARASITFETSTRTRTNNDDELLLLLDLL